MTSKIDQYRKKFLDELDTDENADYRRGFYAGCLFAALESDKEKVYVYRPIEEITGGS